MNLTERPYLRLLTLCTLYLAQGIPYGFVYITLKAWLGDSGLTLEAIGGLLALGTLPWTFKPVWGPIIDGVGPTSYGRRRPWILVAQAGMAVTIAAMLAVPDLEASTKVLGAMVFVHNIFNSLQDVSVDALAVDLLSEEERGRANGLMYGSKYGGVMIGGAGLATVAGTFGLQGALLVQVVTLLAIMALPLLLLERPGERRFPWEPKPEMVAVARRGGAEVVQRTMAIAKDLLRAFSLRSPLVGALFAWLVHIPVGIISTMGALFFVQHLAWEKEFYAQIEGGPVMIAGLIASVAGGFLADLLGRRRLIGGAVIAVALLTIGFSFAEPLWTDTRFVIAFMVLDAALVGLVTVGLFALYMDVSWPKVAATQFTTYMALLNLSTTTGQWTSGWVEKLQLDYSTVFLLAGIYQLAIVGLLFAIDPGQTRRVLGTDTGEAEAEAA